MPSFDIVSVVDMQQVRVTGKSINDLQEVIGMLKAKDLGVEMKFVNFRP